MSLALDKHLLSTPFLVRYAKVEVQLIIRDDKAPEIMINSLLRGIRQTRDIIKTCSGQSQSGYNFGNY